MTESANHESLAWERLKGEKPLWFGRFRLFCWMGWKRSLYGACVLEWEMEQRQDEKAERKRPTGAPGAWRKAAERNDWLARAEAWDSFRAAAVEKNVRQAWQDLSFLLPEAVRELSDVLKSVDEEQRRIAATAILQRAFTLWGGGDPDEKPQEIQFVEFV